MKRVIIVVEGYTEEEFVNECLAPFLYNYGIYDVRATKITTSKGHKGGFVNYNHLKNDIEKFFKSETNILVSTFVDYFRLPDNLPNYQQSLKISDVLAKINFLEQEILKDIDYPNFIPYIQKYEFEALLFASPDGFNKYFDTDVLTEIEKIIAQYVNPEDINDSPNTAPSKRLVQIIPNYNKKIDGNLIALEIGIAQMLEKCPKFKLWVESLILNAE